MAKSRAALLLAALTAALAATLLGAAVAQAETAADALRFGPHSSLGNGGVALSRAVPDPWPLTGEGENMEIVANVPMDPGDTGLAASDIELAGNYAFVGSYGEGMMVADISDPLHPKRVATFVCGGGSQYDVQLSPDARYAVLSSDSTGASCLPDGESGSMILDISNPLNPHMIGFAHIESATGAEVGTHTQTLDWPILYVNNYPTSYHRLEIFDLSTPSVPRKISELDFGDGESSVHDLIVDHRPDGRVHLYAASISNTDVIDVTDLYAPTLKQRIADDEVSISHQAEPNHARDLLIVTDEYQGGGGAQACGQVGDPTQLLPGNPNTTNIGAIHFYRLTADGTMKDNGTDKPGTFNLPLQQNDPQTGCTVHVFWQAPDENRLVTAWYGKGIRVVDFSDPANAEELGYFIPEGADTWSAKPHNGYIFTGDIIRGMDVLRYTGEGGARWPTTAGPADIQRAQIQQNFKAATTPPPTAAAARRVPAAQRATASRRIGGFRFKRTVRVPRSRRARRTVTATFRTPRGRIVSKLRFKVRSGRRARLRADIGGLVGSYRFTLRLGDRGKVLRRGKFTVKDGTRTKLPLAVGRTLVCRII